MPTVEPIRIEVSQGPNGADMARCGGFVVMSRHGAEMAMARALVAAGFPDTAWQTERCGQVRLHGPSLHGLARLTLNEGDRQRITFARWVPMVERPGAIAA